MRGKLFGIGTGPGDPDLITLKAIKTIEHCDIIAVPSNGSEQTAFKIIEDYVKNKELMECSFIMVKDEEKRIAHRLAVANDICEQLDNGKNVGFITLGDPSVYSTYMYVHKIVTERGYETEIIPGIPSFIATAATLNTSLCEGDEMLHIIPGTYQSDEDIENVVKLPGNKVIMKSGKNLAKVLEVVQQSEKPKETLIVEKCGMDGQRIFKNIDEFMEIKEASYFSVALVKEDY